MLKDIMNPNLVAVYADTTIPDVARLMEQKNVGSVLVVDTESRPKGILTDRDIVVRCIGEHEHASLEECRAGDLMSEPVLSLSENEGIYQCAKLMREQHARRIAVVDGEGRATGIISAVDILSIISNELMHLSEAVRSEARTEKKTIKAA